MQNNILHTDSSMLWFMAAETFGSEPWLPRYCRCSDFQVSSGLDILTLRLEQVNIQLKTGTAAVFVQKQNPAAIYHNFELSVCKILFCTAPSI